MATKEHKERKERPETWICGECGGAQASPRGNPNIDSTFCLSCHGHNVVFKKVAGYIAHVAQGVERDMQASCRKFISYLWT